MNEEEFLEAETKRIWRIYTGLGLLLLFVPMAISIVVRADLEFDWLFLIFSVWIPSSFFLLLLQGKETYGFWHSREALSSIHLKGLSVFILLFGAGVLLASIILSGGGFMENPLFIVSFAMIFLVVVSSLLAVKYIEKGMKRKLEKFEMSRSALLFLPVGTAKEVVIKALEKLNLKYSEVIPKSKFDQLWHVEFESGMRIYALSHFKNSELVIARIPKNDTLEPEIEKEILRLANLRES